MAENFPAWLEANLKISTKGARDIVSRLRRVRSLVPEIDNLSLEDALEKLEKNSDFQSISYTIKSQLRRALKLYTEFQE